MDEIVTENKDGCWPFSTKGKTRKKKKKEKPKNQKQQKKRKKNGVNFSIGKSEVQAAAECTKCDREKKIK